MLLRRKDELWYFEGDPAMSGVFEAESWRINLPKKWSGEWHDDIATIYDPDGVGALQISEHQNLETDVTDEDLLDFIEEVPADQTTPFSAIGFVGLHYRYVEDATHWEKWLLRHADVMLFATYNCDIADSEIEKRKVFAAVGSISPR